MKERNNRKRIKGGGEGNEKKKGSEVSRKK
jgi:hypothetical protein